METLSITTGGLVTPSLPVGTVTPMAAEIEDVFSELIGQRCMSRLLQRKRNGEQKGSSDIAEAS